MRNNETISDHDHNSSPGVITNMVLTMGIVSPNLLTHIAQKLPRNFHETS